MTSSSARAIEALSTEVLNPSWEYADVDTQHLTHNIHRYSGKFIPQIAARAIALLTRPGDLVVDPYCGSGTTLLESALLRRRAIGIDLNPLAVLIARVKTTPIPEASLNELARSLGDELAMSADESRLPLFQQAAGAQIPGFDQDPRSYHKWYRKWFQPHVLRELLAVDAAIRAVDDQSLRDVALVAFSNVLRRSSNAHSGYPNVMFDRNSPVKRPPIPLFLKTLKLNIAMIASLSSVSASWSDVHVVHGNATTLPIADSTVDAVVSHPPYVGSIPYAEYGALSLRWLGVDPKQLDRQLTGGRRQSRDVIQRFERDYRQMLRETQRVLRPGRQAFLMVGNPIVRGRIVDLAEMTLKLAVDAGLELAARAERYGINRRANNMGTEHLLFFRKPSDKR